MSDIVERLLNRAANAVIVKEKPNLYYDAAHEIEKLRKALKAILNDAGYHNPMRMTTEISDKILEDAAGALNDYNF